MEIGSSRSLRPRQGKAVRREKAVSQMQSIVKERKKWSFLRTFENRKWSSLLVSLILSRIVWVKQSNSFCVFVMKWLCQQGDFIVAWFALFSLLFMFFFFQGPQGSPGERGHQGPQVRPVNAAWKPGQTTSFTFYFKFFFFFLEHCISYNAL